MLTAKGKYGLKALIHLSSLQPGEMVQAVDIAIVNRIPKKFLGAILGSLRNAGFVHAKKGPGGGYRLARPAREIKLGNAIRALDGPLAPITCASCTAFQRCRDCKDFEGCVIRMTMIKVRDAMSDILDRTTLAEIIARDDGSNLQTLFEGADAVT